MNLTKLIMLGMVFIFVGVGIYAYSGIFGQNAWYPKLGSGMIIALGLVFAVPAGIYFVKSLLK